LLSHRGPLFGGKCKNQTAGRNSFFSWRSEETFIHSFHSLVSIVSFSKLHSFSFTLFGREFREKGKVRSRGEGFLKPLSLFLTKIGILSGFQCLYYLLLPTVTHIAGWSFVLLSGPDTVLCHI